MAKIVIIADDLTGAADCGVAFAGCGTEGIVVLGGQRSRLPDFKGNEGPDVLAIDADTRCLGPERAAKEVDRMVRSLCGPEGGPCRLFKKVDSTLRGNGGVELAAALNAIRELVPSSTRVVMLFAPAFPAQGRTTVNGIQMVNGRPLEQAGLGRGVSAAHGNLVRMLEEVGLSCGLMELASIRGGGVLDRSMQRIANEADAVICDAETGDDLRAITQAGMALGLNTVWAGSAGLARHLAMAIGCDGIWGARARLVKPVQACGPTLFVVGSPALVSRDQANVLAAAPGVERFTFVVASQAASDLIADHRALEARIMDRLANDEDVLVQLECAEGSDVDLDRGLARTLGRALRACVLKVGALVVTGGETARAILDAWGVRTMRLVGEVEPGLPYSVAECEDRSIRVLTKAGGFGTTETLVHCREFLRNLSSSADEDKAPAAIEGRKS